MKTLNELQRNVVNSPSACVHYSILHFISNSCFRFYSPYVRLSSDYRIKIDGKLQMNCGPFNSNCNFCLASSVIYDFTVLPSAHDEKWTKSFRTSISMVNYIVAIEHTHIGQRIRGERERTDFDGKQFYLSTFPSIRRIRWKIVGKSDSELLANVVVNATAAVTQTKNVRK